MNPISFLLSSLLLAFVLVCWKKRCQFGALGRILTVLGSLLGIVLGLAWIFRDDDDYEITQRQSLDEVYHAALGQGAAAELEHRWPGAHVAIVTHYPEDDVHFDQGLSRRYDALSRHLKNCRRLVPGKDLLPWQRFNWDGPPQLKGETLQKLVAAHPEVQVFVLQIGTLPEGFDSLPPGEDGQGPRIVLMGQRLKGWEAPLRSGKIDLILAERPDYRPAADENLKDAATAYSHRYCAIDATGLDDFLKRYPGSFKADPVPEHPAATPTTIKNPQP